jgi:hypothetical protein
MPLKSTLAARRAITSTVAMTQNAIDTRARVVNETIGHRSNSNREQKHSPKDPVMQARLKSFCTSHEETAF